MMLFSRRGLTLIEIIVALAIMAMIGSIAIGLCVDDTVLFESLAMVEFLDETLAPRLHETNPLRQPRRGAREDRLQLLRALLFAPKWRAHCLVVRLVQPKLTHLWRLHDGKLIDSRTALRAGV